jgi:hypothetical protein
VADGSGASFALMISAPPMRETLHRHMGIELRTLDDLNQLHDRDSRARAFVVGAMCKAVGQGYTGDTVAELERRLGPRSPYVAAFQKAAVAPMGTTVGELQPFGAAFLRLVAARSAFEGLGLPKVPPRVRVALANGDDLTVGWVAEGAAIPLANVPLDFETLTPRKLALLIVLTSELVTSTASEATTTVERILTQSVASSTDAVAFDPTVTGSLTAGAAEVTSTGDIGDGVAAVLAELSGGVASRPALILGAAAARLLVFSGDDIFKDVALAGPGSIAGVPTFTSPSRAIATHQTARPRRARWLCRCGSRS